jgi:hypothetical protein
MEFGGPPSLGVDPLVKVIHQKLAEVNSETNVELHKRVGDAYKEIKVLKGMLEKVKSVTEGKYVISAEINIVTILTQRSTSK